MAVARRQSGEGIWTSLATCVGLALLGALLLNAAMVREYRLRSSQHLFALPRRSASHTSHTTQSQQRWQSLAPAAATEGPSSPAQGKARVPTTRIARRIGSVDPLPLDLILNTAARQLLGGAGGGAGGGTTLFVTFGSGSMTDFMHNWMFHVRRIGVGAYVLAALDERTLAFCDQADYPSATLPPAAGAGAAAAAKPRDGGYYRMDHELFLRMGVQKADLLGAFVRAGYDVLLSDLDVVWLADPRPFLAPASAPDRAALASLADVVTASDAVDVEQDSAKGAWLTRQEINTGVLLFRATPAAVAIIDEWRRLMVQAIDAKRWELQNDQLFFNRALSSAGLEPVAPSTLGDALAAAGRPNARELAATAGARADVRGLFAGRKPFLYSREPPHLIGRGGGSGAVAAAAADGAAAGAIAVAPPAAARAVGFRLGTFSIGEFANGHTFFVQRLAEAAGLRPFMVHTTHQFADTSTYALGKRQRLREHGLWAVDPPGYYADGDFLQLSGPLLTEAELAAAHARFARESDPRRHIAIDALQREVVRDALALARATGRTLIMPELLCWCDRFWNRLRECRYPSDRGLALPFRCPMDHLFFLNKWDVAGLRFREGGFLDNPRTPSAVRDSVVRLELDDAAAGAAGAGETRQAAAAVRWDGDGARLLVRPGACFDEIAAVLRARAQPARVLRLDALALRRLCPWLGSARAADEFNRAASSALHHTVRFCTVERLEPPPASEAEACPWGYRPPGALPASEAAARAYVATRAPPVVTAFSEPRACRRGAAPDDLAYACS